MVAMTAREEIVAASGANGWLPARETAHVDWFERAVQLDGTPFGRLAKKMGWEPMEEILVIYTTAGHVHSAVRRTPANQTALEGVFRGNSGSLKPEDKNKKQQVLEWLSTPTWHPEEKLEAKA